MSLQQVEIAVRDGQEMSFEGALLEVRQRVFMSPGFRDFNVAQAAESFATMAGSSTYLVQVRWETIEELAAFDADRFDRCWAPVQSFLDGPLRVNHFVERANLGFQGPGVITDLAWLSE